LADYQYDLFVIGAGSGGVRASRMAAQHGVRVAIAEDTYLGGTCVNAGCVPKKLLVYGSQFSELFRDSQGFGWDVGSPLFDWPRLIANKDREIQRLNEIYGRLLQSAGVTLYEGRATLVDAHTVEIGDQRVTAAHILLAPGGWPWVPPFPGSEHAVTSNEIFHLKELPDRVVVVGGGYIAVEFAGILNGMGAKTHLLYRGELFLRGFDRELRLQLMEEMRQKGVDVRFNTDVASISGEPGNYQVTLKDGAVIDCDLVLYATGRRPRTAELGLDAAGVRTREGGYIVVDEQFRTSVPHIYAIGDAIGVMELTPVALAQGMAVARTLFGNQPGGVDMEYVPTAIFSQPSLASVGYTEELARERFHTIKVFTAKFTQMRHTLAGNPEKTLMKLIVDAKSDRVVGVHMLGPEAAEITKAHFDATIGIHPSAAEEFVTMRTPTR
jgi:glutathione reductase (NADPH)